MSNIKGLEINTVLDSVFTGTNLPASSNGCDAIYFYAFEDSLLMTPFSDSLITLTAADAISPGA